jgi:hypothetical protein
MKALEYKVRTAMRQTGEEIAPHSVPPLQLRRARRLGLPRPAAPRRWSSWLTPLAAAASMAAVVAASLAISATFHGHSHGPGPAPAARSHGAPAGGQAALRDVPRYFVSLSPMWTARSAEVRSTVTGRTLATITPPRPYRIFTWVSAAADDHTFVLAAQRYWHIGHGQAGMPAQNRDNATPTAFFKLTFDPATHTAALTPLAIPETIPSADLAGVGLSPDGTRLALDIRQPVQAGPRQSVQVVTLATGAIRSWTWHGSGWIGNWKPYGQVFSWAADGKTLEFQQWGGKLDETAHVRLLNTSAPGSSANSARSILTFPNTGGTADFSLLNTLLTLDGGRIVTSTVIQPWHPAGDEITEFSARTGKPVRTEDRFAPSPGWQNVLWAGTDGKALVVSDPRGKKGTYGRANILGVLEGNRFTPIPHGADTTGSIAW